MQSADFKVYIKMNYGQSLSIGIDGKKMVQSA